MGAVRDDDRPELQTPILQGLGQAVPQVDPPLALRARVLASGVGAPTTRPASARSTPWLLATAASLVLAAGLGMYTPQLRGRIGALEDELRDARARATSAEQRAADALQAAADADHACRANCAGRRAHRSRRPGADRTAGFGEGVLEPVARDGVHGVQPSAASARTRVSAVGRHRATSADRSAGLLTPDAQGGVNETFNTPSDIPQPVALAVTIEPAGGVRAPTGEKYLVGTVAARPA